MGQQIRNDYHLGHMIVDSLGKFPDLVNQIDAATGEKETNASLLSRSIRLAKCLNKCGYVPGDVLILSATNHLDTRVVHYAGLMQGISVAGVDPLFKCEEIKSALKVCEPKVVFCQAQSYDEYVQAVKDLGQDVKIIYFGDGAKGLNKFMQEFGDLTEEEFKPAEYDVEKISPWLVPTSGTSGGFKMAAYKTRNIVETVYIIGLVRNENSPVIPALNLSPVQWVSGFLNAVSYPLTRFVTVQTSAPLTPEHLTHIINIYRPVNLLTSPPVISMLVNQCPDCDLTCFNSLMVTGGKLHDDLLIKLRERIGNKKAAFSGYGQTEVIGPVLLPCPEGPLNNCGKEFPNMSYKLVDPETNEVITKPHVTGELWVSTSGRTFSHYHNSPEQTAEALSGEWYKTGDLLYRDEDGYYFFVDRFKMLIKYRNIHVIPTELEAVIFTIEGVRDVMVTSIPHPDDGEHPVAVVVREKGSKLSAQEIKDYVADKLSINKQLRGGVVFLDEIPYLPTGKPARLKIKKLINSLPRE